MSILLEEIEERARLLTPGERVALARFLIKDLDPSADGDVEQLWIAESELRYQGHLNGEIDSYPGDEVISRVRKLL